jgi:hypothetical protein
MVEDTCSRSHLEKLAEALIARHLRVSVPDSSARDWLAEQKPTAYPIDLVESRVRCIVVVGAGASDPVAARSEELAERLERKFGRDEIELERLQLVNNLDPKAFETRMIALSKTPDTAKQVKTTIAREYNIRYPAVLAYELIAHLLKHRFVDAVVSFNFDELLDCALDDELSSGEYRKIVSERDCRDVQTDTDAANYIPLYIKLHGTASESDSLRLTPESYYNLPTAMVEIVQDLLHAEQCIIVNVGCGLASFDFQRLLRIPTRLKIYDLSYADLDPQVRLKIDDERCTALGIPVDARKSSDERTFDWLDSCANGNDKCDEHLAKLCSILESQAATVRGSVGGIVQCRSIRRHEVAVRLLGAESDVGRDSDTPPRWSMQAEIDYLKKRAIFELALAGAKSRGLLSVVPLARDRPARYYELYQQRADSRGANWVSLCLAAGLRESDGIPDVVESAVHLRPGSSAPVEEVGDGKEGVHPTHKLHEFDPDALARHVARRVKDGADEDDIQALKEAIEELQKKVDVELHTQDDRVCSKVFRQPLTLRTATALKIYTWLMLAGLKPEDHVDISSETGNWLLEDPIVELLATQARLRVLLAFDHDYEKLRSRYAESNVEFRVVNPWHHNRHMTIVCDDDTPIKAIYFARHLRTPVITAVYLQSMRDAARLKKTFDERWKEVPPYELGECETDVVIGVRGAEGA